MGPPFPPHTFCARMVKIHDSCLPFCSTSLPLIFALRLQEAPPPAKRPIRWPSFFPPHQVRSRLTCSRCNSDDSVPRPRGQRPRFALLGTPAALCSPQTHTPRSNPISKGCCLHQSLARHALMEALCCKRPAKAPTQLSIPASLPRRLTLAKSL